MKPEKRRIPKVSRAPFRGATQGLFLSAFVFGLQLSATVVPAQPLTPVAPPAVQVPATVAAPADSVPADSLAARYIPRADTAKVVMHHFNHRQQIITGSAVMAGLLAIMAVMNNYNPRAPL